MLAQPEHDMPMLLCHYTRERQALFLLLRISIDHVGNAPPPHFPWSDNVDNYFYS